tara:strand:- start:3 stop:275 length:273 start_codon:yes stop_codon:yes gene_type:complete
VDTGLLVVEAVDLMLLELMHLVLDLAVVPEDLMLVQVAAQLDLVDQDLFSMRRKILDLVVEVLLPHPGSQAQIIVVAVPVLFSSHIPPNK